MTTGGCYEHPPFSLNKVTLMIEIWKTIKDYPQYQVSSFGRVKSFCKDKVNGRLLKPGKSSTGYFTVSLLRRNSKQVHELVAESFIGPKPKGFDVLHFDGSRDNNRHDNLGYGTRTKNIEDAVFHNRRKVTPEQIRKIRNSSKIPAEILAKKNNISMSHAYNIRERKIYDHVGDL